MKRTNETETLKEAIQLFKLKQADALFQLKNQYHHTCESLKPLNLIKKAFGQIATSAEFKGNILSKALGIATGYFNRKVLLGSTYNPIKRILGTLLQFVMTNLVKKDSEKSKDNNFQSI